MKLSGTNSVMPPVRSCSAADHPHVAGELARLLDVAEHHGRGRAQAGAVGGFDDLDPARRRELVRGDPLADPVVEDLGRGAGGRAEAAVDQVLEDLARRACPSARRRG